MVKYDKSYTVFLEELIRTKGLVVKIGCRESGDMGSIPGECCNPLPPSAILRGTEPVSALIALTRALFYIAALSIILFSWISSVTISR